MHAHEGGLGIKSKKLEDMLLILARRETTAQVFPLRTGEDAKRVHVH